MYKKDNSKIIAVERLRAAINFETFAENGFLILQKKLQFSLADGRENNCHPSVDLWLCDNVTDIKNHKYEELFKNPKKKFTKTRRNKTDLRNKKLLKKMSQVIIENKLKTDRDRGR